MLSTTAKPSPHTRRLGQTRKAGIGSRQQQCGSIVTTNRWRFPLKQFTSNLFPINHLRLRDKLSSLSAVTLVLLVVSGCSATEIPKELKMDELTYDKSESHAFGPAGLNKGFKVYKLHDSVGKQVKSRGVEFLNTMPSAVAYKSEAKGSLKRYSFTEWKSLPVPQDDRWNYSSSHPKFDQKRPVLADYYGGHPYLAGADPVANFHEKIDSAQRETFERLILGKKGYFSYGGFRKKEMIVVDPAENKIYHLYVR